MNPRKKQEVIENRSVVNVGTLLGAPFRRKGRTHSSFRAPDAAFSLPHSSHASIGLRSAGLDDAGDLRHRLGAEGDVPEGRPWMRGRFRPDRRRTAMPQGGGDTGVYLGERGGWALSPRRRGPIRQVERRRGAELVEGGGPIADEAER
jgi:hypothetical protein